MLTKKDCQGKKFVTDKTQIEISDDKNTVIFTNRHTNGKIDKVTLHLKDKQKHND